MHCAYLSAGQETRTAAFKDGRIMPFSLGIHVQTANSAVECVIAAELGPCGYIMLEMRI